MPVSQVTAAGYFDGLPLLNLQPAEIEVLLLTLATLVFSIPVVGLAWRVLRQVTLHKLYPGCPEELPSWIPYFGHIFSFIRDYDSVHSQLKSHSLRTGGGPVSLLLGGASVCFVTSAGDSNSIHKNPGTYNHDRFLQLVARQFGLSKQAVRQLWRKSNSLPKSKPLTKVMAIVRRELSALRRSDGLPTKILQQVWDLSMWDQISFRRGFICQDREKTRTVSLSGWIRDVFTLASTQVLFGEAMMHIRPDMIEDFYAFDDRSWMVLHGIPRPWSIETKRALGRTQHALETYLGLPLEDRADASRVMRHLEEAMQGEAFGPRDVTAVISLIYWGFNTNAWKACFWCMCYIVSDTALLQAIREEVAPVIECSTSPSELATTLKHCPKLNSVYREALRYTAATGSVRESLTTSQLSGKTICPHTDIIITYRGMLTDHDTFGRDSDKFVWDRFLRDGELAKGLGYRPFGDGVGQCPGRFLAQLEILSLVALAVTRFEIEAQSRVPDLNTKHPSLGIMGPASGQDMIVRLTQRVGS